MPPDSAAPLSLFDQSSPGARVADLLGTIRRSRQSATLDLDSLVWSSFLDEALSAREIEHQVNDRTSSAREEIVASLRAVGCEPRSWGLSILEKSELRLHLLDLVESDQAVYGQIWTKATSGTTGRPLEIPAAAPFYFDHLLLTLPRIVWRAGGKLPATGTAVAIALTDNSTCVDELWPDVPRNRAVAQIIIDPNQKQTLVTAARLIHDVQPYAVSIKPSLLESILYNQSMVRALTCVDSTVICSGSNLDPTLRLHAEDVLGRRIVEAYGLTEFGIAASECACKNGLHVDGDVLAEIVDDCGTPVADGRVGHLLLSSLRNPILPLLRYRTGDLAALNTSACACGRSTPRLIAFRGRNMPNFVLPSGRILSTVYFQELFRAFPVAEFQLTQTSPGAFLLVVQPQDGFRIRSMDVDDWLTRLIGEAIDITVRFEMLNAPPGKFERFRREM